MSVGVGAGSCRQEWDGFTSVKIFLVYASLAMVGVQLRLGSTTMYAIASAARPIGRYEIEYKDMYIYVYAYMYNKYIYLVVVALGDTSSDFSEMCPAPVLTSSHSRSHSHPLP